MEEYCRKTSGLVSRWASFENPYALKGAAAWENHGAKGHAFDSLMAGETKTLLNYKGAGIVRRMWFTINEVANRHVLRSLIIRCFWDGCKKPAVEVPFGDFFGMGCEATPFENELFSSPEGKSFNSYVAMPFRKSARIEITNESDIDLAHIFYDINLTGYRRLPRRYLYFHGWWHRENPTELEKDFEILKNIRGRGRFLGTSMVVSCNKNHGMWWGEGVFKAYIDGDTDKPTLCGTGTEDYIGTGWGQGKFINRFQGCTHADGNNGTWAFYRFHIPDPVLFSKSIKVTMQQLGGGMGAEVRSEIKNGNKLVPVSSDDAMKPGGFEGFYKSGFEFTDDSYDAKWINFFRQDDYAATAYFYLDKPISDLPGLQSKEIRNKGYENIVNEK
jgi:hypothetical protein